MAAVAPTGRLRFAHTRLRKRTGAVAVPAFHACNSRNTGFYSPRYDRESFDTRKRGTERAAWNSSRISRGRNNPRGERGSHVPRDFHRYNLPARV